jgi:hypothetical protein
MYVTQPPCKALGIYLDYATPDGVINFVRIGRVADQTGLIIASS